MLNSIPPTLVRLRMTNKQLRSLSSTNGVNGSSSLLLLQQQIQLRHQVLRDMELIQSYLRGLINGQGRVVTLARRRPPSKRRYARRPKRWRAAV